MAMTTIQGADGQQYTLLPHNGWASGGGVKWSRRWETGVATGVKGGEARSALRQLALHKLSCDFVPESLAERARMEARIDQATRSGLGCMAFFGRGAMLSAGAAAGTNMVSVAAANIWTWAAGDWALIWQDDTVYDAVQVQSVGGAGLVLTLAANLINSWGAGASCWPLLFGKFSPGKMSGMSGHLARWNVTVEQLVSERSAQVGVVTAPGGTGIGVDQVGISNPVT